MITDLISTAKPREFQGRLQFECYFKNQRTGLDADWVCYVKGHGFKAAWAPLVTYSRMRLFLAHTHGRTFDQINLTIAVR